MDDMIWFGVWLFFGGLQINALAKMFPNKLAWPLASLALAIGSVSMGLYPSFFDRGEGFFTPNRVVSMLIASIVFVGSAAYAEYQIVLRYLEQADNRIRDLYTKR